MPLKPRGSGMARQHAAESKEAFHRDWQTSLQVNALVYEPLEFGFFEKLFFPRRCRRKERINQIRFEAYEAERQRRLAEGRIKILDKDLQHREQSYALLKHDFLGLLQLLGFVGAGAVLGLGVLNRSSVVLLISVPLLILMILLRAFHPNGTTLFPLFPVGESKKEILAVQDVTAEMAFRLCHRNDAIQQDLLRARWVIATTIWVMWVADMAGLGFVTWALTKQAGWWVLVPAFGLTVSLTVVVVRKIRRLFCPR